DLSAWDKTEVSIFIEIKGARIGRGDQAQLKAGGGKNEHLGTGRNLEGIEEAFKKSFFARTVQKNSPAIDFFAKEREPIFRFAGIVLVRWGIQIHFPQEAQCVSLREQQHKKQDG